MMSRDFGNRLDRIEILISPVGCPTCRSWNDYALVYVTECGETIPDRPEHCGRCGRQVPITCPVFLEGVEPNDL